MLVKGYKLCYKTNKFLGSNVQHGVMAKNTVLYNLLLTDLKCSHHRKKDEHVM